MTYLTNPSNSYSKEAFIKFAIDCGVLKFGHFTLKSGRQSPYFFNAGLFYDGPSLKQLGHFYANTLLEQHVDIKHLFGPAYKGLPLATATAIALAEQGVAATVTFNRKEAKDHGEGGQLIGAPLTGNTIIIDDVITAGTAFREAEKLIENNGGSLTTVIIALNRCERGLGSTSALSDIEAKGIKVISIITLFDLMNYLKSVEAFDRLEQLEAYQREYGV